MSKTPRSLSGKVAVVTGGARGIGQALARALAREGVVVARTTAHTNDKLDAKLGTKHLLFGFTEFAEDDEAFAALVAELHSRARELGAKRLLGPVNLLPNQSGGVVTSGYERRGFRPMRHFYRMRRDLSEPIPDRPLPERLEWRNYSAEIDERLRLADNEAFLDHWSHEPISANDWQQFIVGRESFRADLTWAVMDGEEVAAFSLNRFDPEEAEREGYRPGWIGSLGTRRPWRKRGLASALLVKSMRTFKEAGLDSAVLGVDAQNPTGALGLYEGLGFVVVKRTIAYEKQAGPF